MPPKSTGHLEAHNEVHQERTGMMPVLSEPSPVDGSFRAVASGRCTTRLELRSNYELFNRSSFSIRYWSWNYRGCWHQTCPPIDPR
ncbi:hypothetical protein MRX96_022524 [Rhipicephalus microplus]